LKGRLWVVLKRHIMLKENVRYWRWIGPRNVGWGIRKDKGKRGLEITRPFWTSKQSVWCSFTPVFIGFHSAHTDR
jgi:hypothetical protein